MNPIKSISADSNVISRVTTGICVNCIYAKDCVYLECIDKPIWYCNNYDSYTKQEIKSKTCVSKSNNKSNIPPQSGVFEGICINCEHRITCVNAKTTGGIWHCNEYL
jgi:hypothetical protein